VPKPADIEEARRRLAQHPSKGDPTAEPGETLAQKAARLRAAYPEVFADDGVAGPATQVSGSARADGPVPSSCEP
jgi:hypothetical protein